MDKSVITGVIYQFADEIVVHLFPLHASILSYFLYAVQTAPLLSICSSLRKNISVFIFILRHRCCHQCAL